jgi:hypothetical protein
VSQKLLLAELIGQAILAAMTSRNVKFTTLTTVYPPISNQEAVWLQGHPEVEALLRTSDFYMIAGRAEAKFVDLNWDENTHIIEFLFQVGNGASAQVRLNLREFPAIAALGNAPLWVGLGDKIIRVYGEAEMENGSEPLAWFITEKLLWDASRGHPGIEVLGNLRDLATYDLLYVGIATQTDSFSRLLERGHKARQEILSNEPQRYQGARVTDEIYLFMFKADPFLMRTFEPEHEFTEDDIFPTYDMGRIVADAEKAFVSLLKPKYNIQKFANYPKGSDGLYQSGFASYGYTIGEQVEFNTAHGKFRGARDPVEGGFTNAADAIVVSGDEVRLFISGVDYPAL